jgi:hypothetical protein
VPWTPTRKLPPKKWTWANLPGTIRRHSDEGWRLFGYRLMKDTTMNNLGIWVTRLTLLIAACIAGFTGDKDFAVTLALLCAASFLLLYTSDE